MQPKKKYREKILNEIVEVMAPVVFISSYTIAYHGPNKDILGNVGCKIWNYQKVEDLEQQWRSGHLKN